MSALYDRIGIDYAQLRKPDPRIAGPIHLALGAAKSVVNVGAGAGSYEPADREVTAVEPSLEMIRQRPSGAVRVIQGIAEDLPFDDGSFDAAMAVLSVHHWTNKQAGLREMRRVSRGPIVILTFDPSHRPWLTDYLPGLATLDEVQMPHMSDFVELLGEVRISPVMIPHDCSDGFLYAYWRRPAAYLDQRIRQAISSFWALDDTGPGITGLARDLESGEWQRRYAHLLDLEEFDAGYRLVVAG